METLSGLKKTEMQTSQELSKPPSRIPSRNAPPPPPIKKIISPSPPTPIHNKIESTHLLETETDAGLITKTVHLPEKQHII